MALLASPAEATDTWPVRPAELALRLLPMLGLKPLDVAVAFQLAERVAEQREKFEKLLARCQQECSDASVHDVRVQCRRLIARLLILQEAFPSASVDTVLRDLKRFLKRLGELRDVQVQKQALTNDLGAHPGIAGLWIELGLREQRLIECAGETTHQFKIRKMKKRLLEVEQQLTNPAARLAAKATVSGAIVRALERAYVQVKRRRQAVEHEVPSTVHRVRTAYKKFRYMVESLPPAIAQVSDSQLSAMADYQAAMGKIQDVEVLDAFVVSYGERFPLAASDVHRFRQVLQERRQRLRGEYIAIANADLCFWPLG